MLKALPVVGNTANNVITVQIVNQGKRFKLQQPTKYCCLCQEMQENPAPSSLLAASSFNCSKHEATGWGSTLQSHTQNTSQVPSAPLLRPEKSKEKSSKVSMKRSNPQLASTTVLFQKFFPFWGITAQKSRDLLRHRTQVKSIRMRRKRSVEQLLQSTDDSSLPRAAQSPPASPWPVRRVFSRPVCLYHLAHSYGTSCYPEAKF